MTLHNLEAQCKKYNFAKLFVVVPGTPAWSVPCRTEAANCRFLCWCLSRTNPPQGPLLRDIRAGQCLSGEVKPKGSGSSKYSQRFLWLLDWDCEWWTQRWCVDTATGSPVSLLEPHGLRPCEPLLGCHTPEEVRKGLRCKRNKCNLWC